MRSSLPGVSEADISFSPPHGRKASDDNQPLCRERLLEVNARDDRGMERQRGLVPELA
jgi:hypothetical protein